MVLPIESVIAPIKPWIIFILYRFCSCLSFSLFPEQQKLNKSSALEILAVLKATGCNPVYSQHLINCGLNLLLSFKWDIDLSLTVILRQMGGKKHADCQCRVKDWWGYMSSKQTLFLGVYINACVLGRLQLSPLQYAFIALSVSALFILLSNAYLSLLMWFSMKWSLSPYGGSYTVAENVYTVWNVLLFLLRSAVLCMKWQNASWIVTAVLQIWI